MLRYLFLVCIIANSCMAMDQYNNPYPPVSPPPYNSVMPNTPSQVSIQINSPENTLRQSHEQIVSTNFDIAKTLKFIEKGNVEEFKILLASTRNSIEARTNTLLHEQITKSINETQKKQKRAKKIGWSLIGFGSGSITYALVAILLNSVGVHSEEENWPQQCQILRQESKTHLTADIFNQGVQTTAFMVSGVYALLNGLSYTMRPAYKNQTKYIAQLKNMENALNQHTNGTFILNENEENEE